MTARQTVAGVGGIFFKARDPHTLAAWYQEHLGVPIDAGKTYGTFARPVGGADATGSPAEVVWSVMPDTTKYFAPSESSLMVNYRVSDLDAMLAQLRAAGGWVDTKIEESEFGRFGWGSDPEGNKFELWQPPPGGLPR